MTSYSIDEMFDQIARNQKAMSDVIISQEAKIKRLEFRIQRLEDRGAII